HRLLNIFNNDPKLKYWGNGESLLQNLEKSDNNLEAFITILTNYRNSIKPGAGFILFKAERIIFLVSKIQKVQTTHTIKFFAIIRDPRDVFASQKRTFLPGTKTIMTKNPAVTAIYWKMHAKIYDSLISKKYLVFKYEDLILNYDRTIQKLTNFLKLDMAKINPEKSDLYKRLPKNQYGIHKDLKNKPIKEKISIWQTELSLKESNIIQEITRRYLEFYGYSFKRNKDIVICLILIYQIINYFIVSSYKKSIFHLNNIMKNFSGYRIKLS
ncbi:MAG: sulfotransferase domain-containing protein, partial [Promethearchaeota archaeon]